MTGTVQVGGSPAPITLGASGKASPSTATSSSTDADRKSVRSPPWPLDAPFFPDPADQQPLTPLEKVVAVFTSGFFVTWPFIYVFLVVYALLVRSAASLTAVAVLVGTTLLPAQTRWMPLLDSIVMRSWCKYHRFRVVLREQLQPTGHYCFGFHPHGISPVGPLLFASRAHKVFPGFRILGCARSRLLDARARAAPRRASAALASPRRPARVAEVRPPVDKRRLVTPSRRPRRSCVRSVAASTIFRFPLYRHFMSWLGTQPATFSTLLDQLRTCVALPTTLAGRLRLSTTPVPQSSLPMRCRSLLARCSGSGCVVVGGIAEMFMLSPDAEHVYVKQRKGFVRAAIIAGASIVPVYYFGQSALLNLLPVPGLRRVSRLLRMSVLFPYGRWGFMVPFQMDVTMVRALREGAGELVEHSCLRTSFGRPPNQAIGKPIAVEQSANPSPEYVEQVLAQYMAGLQETYTSTRHHYDGWAARPLFVH